MVFWVLLEKHILEMALAAYCIVPIQCSIYYCMQQYLFAFAYIAALHHMHGTIYMAAIACCILDNRFTNKSIPRDNKIIDFGQKYDRFLRLFAKMQK